MPTRLSKSKFTVGLQCHRRLWWQVNEPDAPELMVDDALQATFDRGTLVGEVARAHVPGGVLVDAPYYRPRQRLQQTQAALAAGANVIYEAALEADGVFVAVDILSRQRRGWTLTEVKSTTKVKPEHVPDAAVQTHVLREAGLDVRRVEVMHLNRECRAPDLSNLFARADVTEQVDAFVPNVRKEAKRQLQMLQGPVPDVDPGDHCREPYECPFTGRCWDALPEHHVSTLHAIRKEKVRKLVADGYDTILHLDRNVELSDVHDRQRRAVQARKLVVDDGLSQALAGLRKPIAYLDFETINPAIPVWDGCRPYDQVPVQFSVHIDGARGRARHVEWLAEGPEDPRESFVRALLEALEGAATIVVYNIGFERTRLRELAELLPHFGDELRKVEARLVDLLPIVRDHVYHHGFGGSFSIKNVLPALVPAMSYDDLEIGDGGTASNVLEQLILGGNDVEPSETRRLRGALLAYCKTDTLAMVKLVERLREVSV